jgi:hypothetical protein
LRVNTFGLYIKANRENCGSEEQIQLAYIDSMAILLRENINYKYERTTLFAYLTALAGDFVGMIKGPAHNNVNKK